MRVLYVISGLGMGGAERQTILSARELVRRGHAVMIYTLNRELARQGELDGSGVELTVDAKRTRLDWSVVGRLRRTVRDWKADLMHGVLYDGNLYARLAGALQGVPVLNSERSDNYTLPLASRVALAATRPWLAGLVANSHAGARFARSLHGLREARVHTIWNGIDLDEVDRRLRVAGRPAADIWPGDDLWRVCVVGALKPAKDHLLALEVAHRLLQRQPRWRFVFAGAELADARDDAYPRQVERRVAELGLQDRVAFVGQRRDVPELMASSDALLVTSRYEGFPNVVLESMACGTPVVSTDYSDVRRILPLDWQVVPDRDPQALADALQRAVGERETLAALQRRWVEHHATAGRCAELLERVYQGYLPGAAELRKELA